MKRSIRFPLVAVSAVLLAMHAVHALAQTPPSVEARELGPFTEGTLAAISPDGRHIAYVSMEGSRFVVMRDGKPGPRYDGIENSNVEGPRGLAGLIFSPDSKRLAYIAIKGDQARVVVDDKEVFVAPEGTYIQPTGPENDPGPPILFSPDGSRYAFWVQQSGNGTQKAVVYVDGQAGPEYQQIQSLCFSPDGKHVAYIATNENFSKSRVVLDGQEGPAFDAVKHLQFVPPGRVAYVGVENDVANAKWGQSTPEICHVMLDGKELGAYDSVASFIQSSNDGAHYAFTATKRIAPDAQGMDLAYFVVHDGKETPYVPARYRDDIGLRPTLKLSADGTRVAYIEQAENGQFVTINGKSEDMYSRIEELEFSPQGKRYSYIGWQDRAAGGHQSQSAFLVVDGQEVGAGQIPPIFSPDESRWATVAGTGRGGGACVLVDGKMETKQGAVPGTIRFSPDGKRIGYFAGSHLVIDGQEIPYPRIDQEESVTFSPDSAHYAYAATVDARHGKTGICIVVDGRGAHLPGAQGSKVYPNSIRFSDDGKHLLHVQYFLTIGASANQVVINGKPVEGYPPLPRRNNRFEPIGFGPDGAVRYLSIKDDMLYEVTAMPAAGDSLASLPTSESAAPTAQSQSQAQTASQPPRIPGQTMGSDKPRDTGTAAQRDKPDEEEEKDAMTRVDEAAKKAQKAKGIGEGLRGLFKRRN